MTLLERSLRRRREISRLNDENAELKATVARLEKRLDRMTGRYIDASNRFPGGGMAGIPMSDQARKIIDNLK